MRQRLRLLIITVAALPALLPLGTRADTAGITPVIGSCAIGSSFGSVTPPLGAQPVDDSYTITGLLTCVTASGAVAGSFSISMHCTTDTIATCVPALAAAVTVTFGGTQSVACSGGNANHIALLYTLGCVAESGIGGEVTAINGSFVFIPNGIPMTSFQVVGVLDLGSLPT